ncbi:plasma membrane calcium [Mycoemilia scoparia]|uniref:Calcium-transporting ATPase n=1 Tax=Mycoemilia scoparia TaxID=417184 RepID=A0A9W7ZVL9_9FUNG|nr:plasma membrane calcium [Mycoemilia scoparia]
MVRTSEEENRPLLPLNVDTNSSTLVGNNNNGYAGVASQRNNGNGDATACNTGYSTVVEDGHFGISAGELVMLVKGKEDGSAKEQLSKIGGVAILCDKLQTSFTSGLSTNPRNFRHPIDFEARVQSYGKNELPEPPAITFWELLINAYNDKTLILLTIAAVVSLAMGIYDDHWGSKKDEKTKLGWVDGVAILLAVAIVCLTNAINDYNQEAQFRKLNAKKDDRMVRVVRQGRECEISVRDVVVGDILMVECGDALPVDGIFTEGSKLACDESSLTGESDPVKKGSIEDNRDPVLLSGSSVIDGDGRMVVVAVGQNSSYGRFMQMLNNVNDDSASGSGVNGGDETPLQKKLDILVEHITKFGLLSALLMFLVLTVRYLVNAALQPEFPLISDVITAITNILIQAITIIVVAVPEGLPMAVTIALVYASSRMIKDNNLVRQLAACETMGGATAICSDKTGTLTENRMTVVSGVISQERFDSTDQIKSFYHKLPKNVQDLLSEGIAINSTAFEDFDEEKCCVEFKGSKTECALLNFTKTSGCDYHKVRKTVHKALVIPFSSRVKSMTTIVDNKHKSGGSGSDSSAYCAHAKGASEIMLANCTMYVDSDGAAKPLDDEARQEISKNIAEFAHRALRTIGLAYKNIGKDELDVVSDFQASPTSGNSNDNVVETITLPVEDMIWLGVVGIQDPLRPNVIESVKACQNAGVVVRMITGDNIDTATAIAKEAGILVPGSVAIEGSYWRKLTPQQQQEIIPRLSVMARSSPEDKLIMVKCLQKLDQVVAMTGDGSNDSPALKSADVGFSMGISGTEIAKEASDIVLMDDNFASIVQALKWGRSINESVRKFLQFQLSVNIAAVFLTFLSAIFSESGESVLTAVQLLWVNMIMDTLAALALATESPTDQLLERLPIPLNAALITYEMWSMIVLQAVFQVCVNLSLIQYGGKLFHLDMGTSMGEAKLRTIVFNTFVFLQIFNELNCRRIMPNQFNVFHHLHKDYGFLAVQVVVIALQWIIVTFGGKAFGTVPLDAEEWAGTIFIGSLALPVGFMIRCLPNISKLLCLESSTSPEQQYVPIPPDQVVTTVPLTHRDKVVRRWRKAYLAIRFANIRKDPSARATTGSRSIKRKNSSKAPSRSSTFFED